MIRFVLVVLSFVLYSALGTSVGAEQASLKIAPLQYRESLGVGEKKKGYIDVSNPTSQPIKLNVDVQAFKQINNKGELTYFDNEQIRAGIKTDFDTIDLQPRQALRMVFLVDGTKLPKGNIFATIFFTTLNTEASQSTQQIRLGTILSITNQTPPSQRVSVTAHNIPLLQLGDTLSGKVTIKNTGDPKKEGGIYPKVTFKIAPLFAAEYTYEAKLVFPGIARENQFSFPSNRVGIYRVSVQDNRGNELAQQWVVALTGWTRLLFVGVVCIAVGYALHRRNQREVLRGHHEHKQVTIYSQPRPRKKASTKKKQ